MSILRDMIEKKAQELADSTEQVVVEPAEEEQEVKKTFNRKWLLNIANHYEFQITDKEVRALNILKKLNERDGHCPCGGMTDEFLCPCKNMRIHGHCKCGLFESAKDINPVGSMEAKIKERED